MSVILGFIDFKVYQQLFETFLGKENFKNKNDDDDDNTEKKDMDSSSVVKNILHILIFLTALYFWFTRNSGKNFDGYMASIPSFLVSFCCSICYVAYALAVPLN